jgi:hypothetical protein
LPFSVGISSNLSPRPNRQPFSAVFTRVQAGLLLLINFDPPFEQAPAPHTDMPVTISPYAADTPLSYLRVSDVGHIQTLVASVALVPCSAKWYLRVRHSIASFRLRLIGNRHSGPLCDTPCPTDLSLDLTTATSGSAGSIGLFQVISQHFDKVPPSTCTMDQHVAVPQLPCPQSPYL